MKALLTAALVALSVGLIDPSTAVAAPASGTALAQVAAAADGLTLAWWDRYGRWHPDRRVVRRPYMAVPPYVVVPRCRTVRVCNAFGRCWWQRRCY
ncbi:MAG TPA: hypothetical protein VIH40_09495 [Xanthobacteraceae bacterium]